MKIRYFLLFALGAFLLALIALMTGMDRIGEILLYIAVIAIVLVLPFTMIIYACVHYRELENKRKTRLARVRKEKLLHQEVAQKKRADHQKKYEIVEVKYLGPGAVTYKHGSLSGVLWGGFLGGPIGFIVGALIGSPNPKDGDLLHQFAVKYRTGRIEIKELHPNSWEYKKLIKMIKPEQL